MKKTLALVVLCTSCAYSQPYLRTPEGRVEHQCTPPALVGVSPEFSIEQRDAIQRAVEYWNYAIGAHVLASLGDVPFTSPAAETGGFVLVYLSDGEYAFRRGVPVNGVARMHIHKKTGCIVISSIEMARAALDDIGMFETMIRHELGHVLGLRDTYLDTSRLMNHRIDTSRQHPMDARQSEIDALRKIYNRD